MYNQHKGFYKYIPICRFSHSGTVITVRLEYQEMKRFESQRKFTQGLVSIVLQ